MDRGRVQKEKIPLRLGRGAKLKDRGSPEAKVARADVVDYEASANPTGRERERSEDGIILVLPPVLVIGCPPDQPLLLPDSTMKWKDVSTGLKTNPAIVPFFTVPKWKEPNLFCGEAGGRRVICENAGDIRRINKLHIYLRVQNDWYTYQTCHRDPDKRIKSHTRTD
ncbi:hypothetical protein J6590_031819 [Homalodisca vitripennis]|nr:hypothetical protein J6590_031819 [Homalodisca vitripennis]